MTDRATDDAVDAEVARALATHAASRERLYYDADADASVRDGYHATIKETASPGDVFRALGALLERTHAPRRPYKPTERVYLWVELHPDGRLRSIDSGKAFDLGRLARCYRDRSARRIPDRCRARCSKDRIRPSPAFACMRSSGRRCGGPQRTRT
jgi:hypothetical protein